MTLNELVVGEVKKIAGEFAAAAGPAFSRRGYLLFCDVGHNRIHMWDGKALSVFRERSNGARSLTFDHQGRLLVAERNRITRTEKDGRGTLQAAWEDAEPNDVVYAIDGSIYFSDRPSEPIFTSRVYQINRRGILRPVTEDCAGPNGIALAPNQRKFYVSDAAENTVRVYDVAPEGWLANGRVLAKVEGPGGLKTDESGNVWVAAKDGVAVFDSRGGAGGTLKVPERPSNLNWGNGFSGLYITAGASLYLVGTKVSGTRTY